MYETFYKASQRSQHLISARKIHKLMLLVCFCVIFCKWRGIFLWSCLFLFLDVPQGRSRSKWRLMFRWLSEFRTVCPPHYERCPGQEVKPCHGAGSHCSCDQVKFIFPNLNSNTTSNCLETSFHAPLRLLTACLGNMYRVLCLGMCKVEWRGSILITFI